MKVVIALAVMTLGACGDGATTMMPSLVGKWSTDYGSGGVTTRQTYELLAGGAVNISYAGVGACSGTVTYTGGTWSATATTITITTGGPGSGCTGGPVTCTIMGNTVTPIECGGGAPATTSTASYTLSGNTLIIMPTGSASITFTRS